MGTIEIAVRHRREPVARKLTAAAAANCIANITWWMQPILMHYLVTSRGMNETASGVLLTIEMSVMAVSSAAIARFGGRIPLWYILLFGMPLLLAAAFVTLRISDYSTLLLVRSLAGLGSGAVLMVSNKVTASFIDPDSAFARVGMINLIFGTIFIGALPLIDSAVPGASPFFAMALASVVLSLGLVMLPGQRVRGAATVAETALVSPPVTAAAHRNMLLIAVAMFLVSLSGGTFFALFGLIGEDAGLTTAQTDSAIAIAILIAAVSSGLVAIMGGRFGRTRPVAIALLIMTVAAAMLSLHPSSTGFRLATAASLASSYCVIPYLFGAATAQGGGGQGAAYASSAFFLAGAISPTMAGMLLASTGIWIAAVGTVFGSLLAGCIVLWVERSTMARTNAETGQ